MSINHYSSEHLAHQTHFWPPYYMLHSQSPENTSSSINSDSILTNFFPSTTDTMFRHPNTSLNFNLNNEKTEEVENEADHEISKEPLFEKPLTPSDVGKLNRLVIPKQHAERYFPLNGSNSATVGESNEKGLLLSFEDELGKSWRFRYSYWNSSQSYVLTKGWSRFVKEKKLDAGDVVLFFRHRGDANRMFIGWRKRNSGGEYDCATASVGGGGRWNRGIYSSASSSVCPYPTQNQKGSGSVQYQQQPDNHHCQNAAESQNLTMSTSNGTPKRLRLFGVNLECQAEESESSTPDGSPMSSQSEAHTAYQYHQYYPNHYNHMDINFCSSGGGSGENVYQRQR